MIGICYTKSSNQGIYVADALYEGFSKFYACRKVTRDNYRRTIPMCDRLIQICYPNYVKISQSKDKPFFQFLYAVAYSKIRTLFIETGFMQSQVQYDLGRITDLENQVYYSVGEGGVKNRANYFNNVVAADRLAKLDIEISPQKDGGKYIVICGQAFKGISSQDINIQDWYVSIYNKLKKFTNKPIAFASHPKTSADKKESKVQKEFFKKYLPDIEVFHQFKPDAFAVVSYSSNVTVDTLIDGIPTYTCSDVNIAWPITSHSLEFINDPYLPSIQIRKDFLVHLAYAQWNVSEMRSGRVAEHVKTFCGP